MEKRYQVFISSTFADLKEERGKVQQAVMELDCIPAGMELFPAIDEEQFEFIKKVIDDCDYYLLIIGGRYGSLSNEGVSYTEMEYNYAVSRGIKVIAFLHKDPNSLPVSKSETDAAAREKLAAFRDEASKGRLVRFWTEANELPGLTLSSLTRTIRTYPAVGWVRGDSIANPEVYKELNDLRKENHELRESVAKGGCISDAIIDIAGMDDSVSIMGYGYKEIHNPDSQVNWETDVTWRQIFAIVAPMLTSSEAEYKISNRIGNGCYHQLGKPEGDLGEVTLFTSYIQSIRIQFMALEFIRISTRNTYVYWSLTDKGEKKMIKLLAIRIPNS